MPDEHNEPPIGPPALSLVGVFARFLRFGLLAWGGPTSQIDMIRHELVERDRWVDEPRFRRALAVYQALPGPEAHELCCWFGMLARGRAGSIAAGLGFMLPGFLLMLLCAYFYMRFGVRGAIVGGAFAAAQAAVVGLVLRATVRLVIAFASGAHLGAIAMMAGIAQLMSVPFWVPLLVGGIANALARSRFAVLASPAILAGIAVALWIGSHVSLPAAITEGGHSLSVETPGALRLFGTGLTGGLVSFGGAYTAIPVVHDASTGPHGWMTEGQFLDGIAIGGVLPAPLVIFGTFVGYIGGGFVGALLVTLGIFLPAFGFTLLGHGVIERLVAHERLHAFLDGLAAAVAGLIATTALFLLANCAGVTLTGSGDAMAISLTRPSSLVIAAVSCALLFLVKGRWIVPILLLTSATVGAMFL